ncbi:hypothetical protein [Streptomyces sp. KLOTTS4A1]|uniref:hypothetical protein n=1 Tax=Streptomyces sp. KLOTTS4A1 TaxID=3390996 RepID=UPI0039F52DA0
MLNVPELLNLRLADLKTAVDDWDDMVAKLRRLATGQGEGVSATELSDKTRRADWSGVNATVNKKFVLKTAGEFNDAVTAATSVHAVLRDAHSAFLRHKDELNLAIADATKRGIYINDKGGAVPPSAPPGVAGEKARENFPTEGELLQAENTVTRILREADDTDRVTARALRALAKNKHDFTDKEVTGLKGADKSQGAADAKYWTDKITRGGVEDWSDDELRRFQETLAIQHDNPEFAEVFATGMGADGMLDFWGDLTVPGNGRSTPYEGERAELLGRIQENLSLSLATATHVDSEAMDTWKKEVIAAGGKQFGNDTGVIGKAYGYQVMSSLMVKGEFESGFLRDYGNSVREFEETRGYGEPAGTWGNPGIGAPFDYTGKEPVPASDPMSGYLRAVSHNPDFATELFNDDSWADYLLSEREFYDEDAPRGRGDGTTQSRDSLGKAMLAAGTGLNPDVPHFVDSYEHTEGQDSAFRGIMERLAEQKNDFPPELRDDMAALLANHGATVHESMSALDATDADLDYQSLVQVSKQVSRDQDAYGILMEGVNHAIIADIHAGTDGDPRENAKEELVKAGRTVGFMEAVRYQAIDTDKEDPSWSAKWAYHGYGGIANFIPVVGDAVQRGVDAGAYAWQLNEQERIDEGIAVDKGEVSEVRQRYLKALGDEWSKVNPDHDLSVPNDADLRQHEVNVAASLGNGLANRYSQK